VRNRTRNLTLLTLIPVIVVTALPAAAQTLDLEFYWEACATEDGDGGSCAPAVSYEVWLKRGSALEERIATVNDTLYTLAAESNVVQRIRVCGYDEQGRQSVFSEWSDPVYFETQRSPVVPPIQGDLRPNYPNPFNPQTRIVYGVPVDLPANALIRLEVLDLHGRRVRTLEVNRGTGWHEVLWDGTDTRGLPLPTGTYFSRFTCADQVVTRKMTMVK